MTDPKEKKKKKKRGCHAQFYKNLLFGKIFPSHIVMCVSFITQVESNGTVLSTNWKEVGSKKVEGSPPDGMEMKKWEY